MKQSSPAYRELPSYWRERIRSWANMNLDPRKTLADTKEVVRWGDYHRLGLLIPVQTVSDHIRGLTFLMDIVIRLIEDFVAQEQDRPLDERLLQGCVLHHDMPEIWLHHQRTTPYDISAARKSVANDLAENAAHAKAFAHASQKAQLHYRRVYLLQAVAKNTPSNQEFVDRLNAEDRRIVAGLRHDRLLEARIFRAVEIFEYYVYSAYCTTLDPPIWTLAEKVVPSSIQEFEGLVAKIPGFQETVWTPELHGWCSQFLPTSDKSTAPS